MTRLVPLFKENPTHTTYINNKDIIVPSVTTILHSINKEELVYWANSLGWHRKSVKTELGMAANIGTHAHSLIDTFINTGHYDLDNLDVTPVEDICIRNAFISFLKFYAKEKNRFDIQWTEKKLSGKRFGGTLDLLTNYNGKLTLGDYKTSKEFYVSMFLQLAGYDILLRELYDKKVEQYMVIKLDKANGQPAMIKIIDNKDEMAHYRMCFKKLLLFYYDYTAINQIYWSKYIYSVII